MSLPKQVQAQMEEAERIEQELLNAANPQQPEAEATEPEPIEVPAPDLEQEPEPVAEPEPAPVDDTWERKYKTLQGMFNAETSRLRSEVGDLKSQLSAAIARLDAVGSSGSAKTSSLVTDKDVEDFGGDLVDLIKRQSTEVADARVRQVEEENARLREQLTGVTEQQGESARRAYFADLGRLVPDYEAINVDERFLNWLAEVDVMSGLPRQEYLSNAFTSYDVERTAVLFNAFKQLAGLNQQPKPVPEKLQRQVAPGTSKSSTVATASPNEKIWSMSEIERFYKEVARGTYKGNDSEQARIEAEIDLAVQEGRLSN